MTAPGENILAYLDTAITRAEQDANRWHDVECDVHAISLSDLATLRMAAEVPGAVCDCAGPASVLRRCAADRKLIALHGPVNEHDLGCRGCGFNNQEEGMVGNYQDCPVLRHLAEGYGWTEGER